MVSQLINEFDTLGLYFGLAGIFIFIGLAIKDDPEDPEILGLVSGEGPPVARRQRKRLIIVRGSQAQ